MKRSFISTLLPFALLNSLAHAWTTVATFQVFAGRQCSGAATEVTLPDTNANHTNDLPGGPGKAVYLQSTAPGCNLILCYTGSVCGTDSGDNLILKLGCVLTSADIASFDRFVVLCGGPITTSSGM